MYCIYTDRDVAEADGNMDHVIPLSLGGADDFTVWAEEKFNSRMGGTVDGAIHRDFFLAPALKDSGVKGHNRKTATPRVRGATIDSRPAQVSLTAEGFKVWDARARRDLADEEVAGSEIGLRFTVDAFSALRFIAKAALGGGYAVYGEPFRRSVDCDVLRRVIELDVVQARTDPVLQNAGLVVCDRWDEDSQPGRPGYLCRVLCEQVPRSMLICQVFADGIAFHVGIVGEFLGTLMCPGDTSELPNKGDYKGGHAVVLAPGKTERLAFDALLREFQAAILERTTDTAATTALDPANDEGSV